MKRTDTEKRMSEREMIVDLETKLRIAFKRMLDRDCTGVDQHGQYPCPYCRNLSEALSMKAVIVMNQHLREKHRALP